MLWTSGERSPNLEDRRSAGGGGGGMGRGLGVAAAGISTAAAPMTAADSAAEEPEVRFVSFVLDDVQNTWAAVLPNYGARYHPARLVLFRNSTDSGCGTAQSVMGPFYCPVDERVYLDLGFFEELKQRFGASGDFAQAHVIAHELGHHVQHLLGTDAKVRQLQES